MVKILSPFRGPDPIAAAITGVGKSMFGDQVGGALKNEQLYELQRGNRETDNLMANVAKSGAQNLGSDPITQAMLIGSGYKPDDFGKIGLMGAATGFGAADQRTQNWQVGTGQTYDNTANAFGAKLAEVARNNNMASADRRYGVDQTIGQQRYEFDAKPMPTRGIDGMPTYAPQGELAGGGYVPILSETEQKGTLLRDNFGGLAGLDPFQRQVLGANPTETGRTPRNYVTPGGSFITYDGVTDAQTGQPLPSGGYIGNVEGGAGDVGLTNSSRTDAQASIVAADKFSLMADRMLTLAKNNPSSFGLVGNVRGKAQELSQAVKAVGSLFGGEAGAAQAANTARRELDAQGLGRLMPELYDPSLPATQMLGGLVLYSGASALAGQEGRDISDNDITIMRGVLGDPMGLFESAESIGVKLTLAKDIVAEHKRLAQEYLARGVAVPEGGVLANEAAANVLGRQGQPQAPAAPAPQADPLSQARAAIARGADRNAVIERLRRMGIDAGGL